MCTKQNGANKSPKISVITENEDFKNPFKIHKKKYINVEVTTNWRKIAGNKLKIILLIINITLKLQL